MEYKLASTLGIIASIINSILACAVLIAGYSITVAIVLFVASIVFVVPCAIDIFLSQDEKEYVSFSLVWIIVGIIVTACYGFIVVDSINSREEKIQQTLDYLEN